MKKETLKTKLDWFNEFGCYIKAIYPEIYEKASDWADIYIMMEYEK